ASWEDTALVHRWGPRYHTYLIAARDVAVFTLGRLPDETGALRVAEELAARLHRHLAGARARYGDAGSALGMNPNRLRYAAATGTVLIRWDGARHPIAWTAPGPAASARLFPSGDAYFLLQGRDRELLVPDASRRGALWTPRVWPGGVLVDGEIVGTWRRGLGTVTIQTWHRLSRTARNAVESEAASLPLPDVQGRVVVRWGD